MSLLNSVECAELKPDHVAAEFDHRALHSQADAKKRNAALAGKANGFDFAFDAAFAETAGHQHAIEAGQQPFGAFALDQFALNALNADLRAVVNAGMIERFVNRFVGIAVLGIFAHDGDRNFVLRIAKAVQQVAPIVDIGRRGFQAQAAADEIVELVFLQAQRHFVDRKILVFFFDHRVDRHVAKQRDFFAIFARQRALGAADEHVGLNTDLPQQADRMLRRLGFQFAGGFQIRHEREVDVQAVFLADVERKLADGFQKRLAFDVADRAADFGDDDIDRRRRPVCE